MNLFPSLRPKYCGKPILTAKFSENSAQLKDLLDMYALPKQTILDVTWGLGAMWDGIDISTYQIKASDISEDKIAHASPDVQRGVMDFRKLDYLDRIADILILDPPYMGGKQTHENLHEAYNNQNDDHEAVIRLYLGGFLEAWRVLKFGGRIFVKCQDELSGGKQRWTHSELMVALQMIGFDIADLFVLVNERQPMMSFKYQRTARKNHSYWIVGIKPFARPTKRKNGNRNSEKEEST